MADRFEIAKRERQHSIYYSPDFKKMSQQQSRKRPRGVPAFGIRPGHKRVALSAPPSDVGTPPPEDQVDTHYVHAVTTKKELEELVTVTCTEGGMSVDGKGVPPPPIMYDEEDKWAAQELDPAYWDKLQHNSANQRNFASFVRMYQYINDPDRLIDAVLVELGADTLTGARSDLENGVVWRQTSMRTPDKVVVTRRVKFSKGAVCVYLDYGHGETCLQAVFAPLWHKAFAYLKDDPEATRIVLLQWQKNLYGLEVDARTYSEVLLFHGADTVVCDGFLFFVVHAHLLLEFAEKRRPAGFKDDDDCVDFVSSLMRELISVPLDHQRHYLVANDLSITIKKGGAYPVIEVHYHGLPMFSVIIGRDDLFRLASVCNQPLPPCPPIDMKQFDGCKEDPKKDTYEVEMFHHFLLKDKYQIILFENYKRGAMPEESERVNTFAKRSGLPHVKLNSKYVVFQVDSTASVDFMKHLIDDAVKRKIPRMMGAVAQLKATMPIEAKKVCPLSQFYQDMAEYDVKILTNAIGVISKKGSICALFTGDVGCLNLHVSNKLPKDSIKACWYQPLRDGFYPNWRTENPIMAVDPNSDRSDNVHTFMCTEHEEMIWTVKTRISDFKKNKWACAMLPPDMVVGKSQVWGDDQVWKDQDDLAYLSGFPSPHYYEESSLSNQSRSIYIDLVAMDGRTHTTVDVALTARKMAILSSTPNTADPIKDLLEFYCMQDGQFFVAFYDMVLLFWGNKCVNLVVLKNLQSQIVSNARGRLRE